MPGQQSVSPQFLTKENMRGRFSLATAAVVVRVRVTETFVVSSKVSVSRSCCEYPMQGSYQPNPTQLFVDIGIGLT